MYRRPSTQDISWFLDLFDRKQLDLEPPYQRKSVWSPKDKKFFIDTIFRNYPSPAIFLHKSINDQGQSLYHVVDGKQRLSTIIDFVQDKIKIDVEFGDERLNGKKWSQISDKEIKQNFWNYALSVEQIDYPDDQASDTVNHIFDRLNRNSKKLTSQELRHAKYDGWFYTFVENQLIHDMNFWSLFKISTSARAKRMLDSQFIAELAALTINEGKVEGFDQLLLDTYYAHYDDLEQESEFRTVNFDEETFSEKFRNIKEYFLNCYNEKNEFVNYVIGNAHFYSVWAILIAHKDNLPIPSDFADRYINFMLEVENAKSQPKLENSNVLGYVKSSTGASTDINQRLIRFKILEDELLNAKEVL